MDTLQINNFANGNSVVKPHYGGCWAADLLSKHGARNERKNKTLPQPIFYVSNLCDSSVYSDLCHWTCIGIDSKRCEIEYFDSGGEASHKSNKYLSKFIKRRLNQMGKKSKVVWYNQTQIQHHTSDRCALFVLCYIYARCVGISPQQFIERFHHTKFGGDNVLQKNDVIVWNLFKKSYLDSRPVHRKSKASSDIILGGCPEKRKKTP